jgi:hypothetical protein
MKKPKSLLLSLFALFICSLIQAQYLSAFTDHMDRFYVFDNGVTQKIEDLGPQSFKVGGEYVMYISSAGHLKVYSNGKVQDLERNGASNYDVTDHLATYSVYENLKVFYDGKIVELSNRCTKYQTSDSLIVFYDKNAESLKVFYNGEVLDIESGMIGEPVKKMQVGDNILAYISERNKDFKIWYKNEVVLIDRNVGSTEFKAGRDIVAYVDETEQNFKAYYKGETYELDNFVPLSFQVGDGFVAFIDQTGEFKVFSNETIQQVSSFSPQTYITEDNILAFSEDNYFKVWYKGEIYEVEPFIPSTFKVDLNSVAYLDRSNRIWLFQDGKKNYLLNDFVNSFEIYRDLIQMNVKVNRNIIYYRNRFYEGLSDYK